MLFHLLRSRDELYENGSYRFNRPYFNKPHLNRVWCKKISQPITTTHASQTMATESIVASTPTSMSAASATISTTAAKTQGIWIDVREAHEYAQGHLKDAVNITGRDLPSQIAGIAPDKNAQINLYCRSGNRSEKARQILLDMGYTNVINQGGYQQLYDKGYR